MLDWADGIDIFCSQQLDSNWQLFSHSPTSCTPKLHTCVKIFSYELSLSLKLFVIKEGDFNIKDKNEKHFTSCWTSSTSFFPTSVTPVLTNHLSGDTPVILFRNSTIIINRSISILLLRVMNISGNQPSSHLNNLKTLTHDHLVYFILGMSQG